MNSQWSAGTGSYVAVLLGQQTLTETQEGELSIKVYTVEREVSTRG